MKKFNFTWHKILLSAIIMLNIIVLAGCGLEQRQNNPLDNSTESELSVSSSGIQEPSRAEETMSSEPSGSEAVGINAGDGPISYEEAKMLVKDIILDVDYEGLMRSNRDRYILYGYGETEMCEELKETCEELKEVLSVYFTCFFHPEIWGDYEFVDDGVMERWEEMYGKAMENTALEEIADQGITLFHIYYEDGEDYFIQVGHTLKDVAYMHLTKTDGQWYVAEDVIGSFYGDYYSEADRERAAALHVEALKKGREENPVTEEMIQEALAEVMESYTDPIFGLTPEETEALKKDVEALRLEAFYEENWCDKILACICSLDYSLGIKPNFNETAFVLWVQPEEGYDATLQDLVNGLYGNDGGCYYLISEGQGEGWIAERLFDIPKFSLRSEEWNAEWNVW